ncbi:glycosyltransferase family 39 protein [Rhizophagus irregularis DAOM 181602=DAOM 197198]|nr:glycosyltransferase family 39 protein [Rhizophagus irregularis DAOM 181602=DAOM 197198]
MSNFIIVKSLFSIKEDEEIFLQHVELPEVDDELSVTLRIKLKSHYSDWATIFRKGGGNERERLVRTPGLFLHANNSKLYPRFTGNWNDNRMDIFINGVWTAFYAIENVQMHRVKFNDKQLDIGCNFRYFNWRLSNEEVMKNYLNQRPFC